MNKLSKAPKYEIDWLNDENVSNHLFRLKGSILESPGIISAQWTNQGQLIREDIWSFQKLQTRALKCINYLQKEGLKKGDRVLLMVRPGLELIVVCFALFRIGCIPIVIDPGMGLRKFKRAVEHSKPDVLVGIPVSHFVKKLFPKSFRSVKISTVVRKGKFFALVDRESEDRRQIDLSLTEKDDLAAILFTSGSTGAPKGVCYEHAMFNAQIKLLKERFGIQPGEIDLPMLPIFALFNPAMGMTTVIPEINPSKPATVNPSKIIAAIKRYKVTNSFGSPVLWRKIGDYCEKEGLQLDTLNRILVAGAAAPTQLYKQYQSVLPNGSLYSPYGATECLPVSVVEDQTVLRETADLTDQGQGICVGTAVDGVAVRIIEKDSEQEAVDLPVGEIGEILVTGPSVTKAYDNLPKANAKAKMLIDGIVWHRMGDMGYLDDDGRLWFCGRRVECVEHEKKVFYTECVEGLHLVHPKIRRCAMIRWNGSGGVQSKNSLALVIEPEASDFPVGKDECLKFAQDVYSHLLVRVVEPSVNAFFFQKRLPVDVRHNAKIHRLTLTEDCSAKIPTIIDNSK